MTMNERDLQELQAIAKAREEHKELAELLDFYYDLYEAQFEAKRSLPALNVPYEIVLRRLESGVPALSFRQLCLEPVEFAAIVRRMAAIFLRHNPRWQAESTDWDAVDLTSLAEGVFRVWETPSAVWQDAETGNRPPIDGLAALVVALALVPYLQLAAEAILPLLDLSRWMKGHCPVCGGKPNLALLNRAGASRQLMCSRCASLWTYVRVGCPYCGVKERQSYYPSETGVYRLYVCPQCNHYLKTVDLEKATAPVWPIVERLLTVNMDLAAQQEGWGGVRFSPMDSLGTSVGRRE